MESQLRAFQSELSAQKQQQYHLTTQFGQIANANSEQQVRSSGSLPSQTVLNLNSSVYAITQRSGKELKGNDVDSHEDRGVLSKDLRHTPSQEEHKEDKLSNSSTKTVGKKKEEEEEFKPTPPFPFTYALSKRCNDEATEKEIMEIFKKVQVNIPLLEAIKQIPKYAKFLKEFCTNKRRMRPREELRVCRRVKSLSLPPLPIKCKDPSTITVPCTIGNLNFMNALLDLGATINVMLQSIYSVLEIKSMKPFGVVIQLAD